MKPCTRNRKLIAWLVLGNLEAERADALREHIGTCDVCHRYYTEISNVAASVGAAEIRTNVEAADSLHRRVVVRVKTRGPASVQVTVREFLRTMLLNWRVALPVAGGIAVVLGLLLTSSQQPPVRSLRTSGEPAASTRGTDSDLPPTIGNYQMVANHSLEELDQLLTQQGCKNLPRVATYTAWTLATESTSD